MHADTILHIGHAVGGRLFPSSLQGKIGPRNRPRNTNARVSVHSIAPFPPPPVSRGVCEQNRVKTVVPSLPAQDVVVSAMARGIVEVRVVMVGESNRANY